MAIKAPAQRPVVLPLRFLDGKVVDARETQPHQAIVVKLPVFIAIGSEPVSRTIVPLIPEPHSDSVIMVRPQFFDQAVVQLCVPLAS